MKHIRWIEGGGDISDALKLRREVFIIEQHTPEDVEMDGRDGEALHLVVYDGGVPVASGRILVEDGRCMLGRICVVKSRRGENLGDFTVRAMIRRAFDAGCTEQFIHAQTYARPFYELLGFEAFGDEFEEADIPHIAMKRAGDIDNKRGA